MKKEEKPYLERLGRIIFIAGTVSVIAVVVSDIARFVRYNLSGGAALLIKNVGVTGCVMSLLWGIPLVIVSVLAIKKAGRDYYIRIGTRPDAETPEERARTRRAIGRLTETWHRYIKVTTAAIIVFAAAMTLGTALS